MSTVLCFPSAEFPAPPDLSVTLPADWRGERVPESTLAAVRDVVPGEFVSNVIVRSYRVRDDFTIDNAAQSVNAALDSLPDVTEIGRESIKRADRSGYRREVSYRDPVAGTLIQAVLVYAVHRETVADVVEVVGTVGAARPQDLPEVRDIQASLTIG